MCDMCDSYEYDFYQKRVEANSRSIYAARDFKKGERILTLQSSSYLLSPTKW